MSERTIEVFDRISDCWVEIELPPSPAERGVVIPYCSVCEHRAHTGSCGYVAGPGQRCRCYAPVAAPEDGEPR